MVYFKENLDITELKVVTTVTKEKEYRKNCKFIKQEYYVINKQCFEIEGKWRRYNDPNVVYDWENQTYALKVNNTIPNLKLTYGIIKNKENVLDFGYFTTNPYNNVYTESRKFGAMFAISAEALGKEWAEDLKTHTWFLLKEFSEVEIQRRKTIKNHENPAARGYNIEDNALDFRNKIELYENYKVQINPKIKLLSKYIGDVTFGCEFELAVGCLPTHLQNRYGVVPCRDGSLNGGMELVTIPMSGAKGLQTLVNLSDDLKLRGGLSFDCSFHIHFGNIGIDKLSIIALYKLCRNLQEELFSMFPYYKTDPTNIKQKNYTKKLQKLNIGILKDSSKEAYEAYLLDGWNKLFNFYAEKQVNLEGFNKKTREHPIHNKWQRNSRLTYKALNLVIN